MNPKADILIVDDERHTREALMRYLRETQKNALQQLLFIHHLT